MAAYFSPAGSTKKVTVAIAEGIAESLSAKLREFDWTVKKNREWRLEFTPSDLLVCGVPTYAGRIPNKVMPYVRENLLVDRDLIAAREKAESNAAETSVFAVPVATYGGRAFDNSLAETAGLLKGNGFAIAGGAAMPCEHVFSDLMQPGRPTEEDLAAARAFGRELGEKIRTFLEAADGAWEELVLPGDYTPENYYQPVDLAGQPTNFLKALPVLLDKKCIGCGRCQAVCPVESIEMEKCAPKMPFGGSAGGLGMPDLAAMKVQAPVVKGICIKCQACVKVCPKGAWTFEDEAFLRHVEMLTHTYGDAERENEFFL
jgi:ferredoxin